MSQRFENKIAFQFVLVTGLLVVVGGAAYSSLTVAVANAKKVEQAHELLRAFDHILTLVVDAETGQRGYLLTGRELYLEPFNSSARILDQQIESLEEKLREEPDSVIRLEPLKIAIAARMAELRATIEIRRTAGFAATLETVNTDQGKRIMDEIREHVRRLEFEGGAALSRQTARAGGDARSAMIVSATGVALTLAMLGFAFRLIIGELAARRRAEADLSQMAAIIASTDDAVISQTLDGVITSWNAAAERLYGYPASEVMGRHVGMLMPPGHHVEAAELLERIQRGEDVGQIETVRRRKDATGIAVEMRVSPIRSESGAVVGASTIARDITARKRAEALLRERTDALEAARARLSAAAEFAAALNQSSVQETYRETLGCLARVAGAPLAVLYDVVDGELPRSRCAVGPDLLPMESEAFQGAGLPATVARTATLQTLAGPFQDATLRTRFGLGEAALQTVVGWPVSFRGRTLGILVTAHTAPIDAERTAFIVASLEQLAVRMDGYQVEQQRLKLMADLRGQSSALETARLEAERANKAKSEFLAAMSHELRTPMNSIMGFTARLLRKLGPTLGERERDALETVDRNAKHLLGLINDILDLSKIEAGKMDAHIEPFDLAALARDAASQSAALFDGKPVELVLDLPEHPVHVEADPKLVKQVVLNLLSNATKFTERGSVTIIAGSIHDELIGEAVRLAVRDTGIGIKPEDRVKLFQRFSQIDGSPSRKVGGTGLGLALSERMIRLHGGRIDVTSEPENGSEFAVVLPRHALARHNEPAPKPAPALKPAPAPPPVSMPPLVPGLVSYLEPQGVSILCVDDEPDALKYLQLTFEDAGYRVFTAGSHDEAVTGARLHRPDLICLDLSMPGKDGFEVLRSLRADSALVSVPILVVAATSEESRALRAGARRYLAKPAEAGALVEAVHDMLGGDGGDVLIVEDDADTCKLSAAALSDRGLTVRTAVNGREAIERLSEATPAAIVLDLMMPVMDGFTFLDHLGYDPVWRNIPVVVLTAKSLEPHEVIALSRACTAVLAKGKGDTGRLVEAVLQALRSARIVPEDVLA